MADERIHLTDPDLVHQVKDVLRFAPGELVELCDGRGMEARATVLEVEKRGLVLRREELPRKNIAEPDRRVTLCVAVLKRENLEWAVQKATELGAAAIWPLLTRRTVKTGVKRERLQLIAKEAAEQSGRGTVPQVREPLALEAALEEALAAGTAWFFETGPDVRSVRMGASGEAFVFIGPEGGWDPEEAEKARRAGCEVISLGPRILRAETAAAVACWEALRG